MGEFSLSKKALLALADGTVFHGESIGGEGSTVGEVVFNTSLTGYQEILTDPSYFKQIVTLTYPHIGNVGINSEDEESDHVFASGLVIRDASIVKSNWRATESLDEYLKRQHIIGIAGIDTRMLTRRLREKGAQTGCIMAGKNINERHAVELAQGFLGLKGMDLAKEVTTQESYRWQEGSWRHSQDEVAKKSDTSGILPHVVAYDFGVKRNILRLLIDRGCNITVVPAQTPANQVLQMEPDGIQWAR